jgi:hypothetical protein
MNPARTRSIMVTRNGNRIVEPNDGLDRQYSDFISQTRSKSSRIEIIHLTFTTILVVAIGLSFTN